ncbi:MAG: sugar transferase, partial [Pseudomonadota bacterium]
MDRYQASRSLKRAMDLIIGFCAAIVTAPLFIIIPLLLKLEGQKGSVFYGGIRIGQNGKKFKCWKFRSMEPDSDKLLEQYFLENPEERVNWERYHKLKNDPRVSTLTAKIIRKTSLDEIPQLWNVFRGEMSLIGPRPILESEVKDYGNKIHYYTAAKPGITGMWQVSGRNQKTFEQRADLDAEYIQNWSMKNDIMILFKTVRVVLSGAGAS